MATDFFSRLAIQSWCFRCYKTHEDVIRALKDCGVSNIELCGIHFDPTSGADGTAVRDTYAKAGVKITAFGVHGFNEDETRARKVFDFAKVAGFSVINADFHQGGLGVAERLSAEYGIRVAIHNHGRRHPLGSVYALESLFAQATPNIGLCLDTAWMLDSGEDPLAVARKFQNRLFSLHVKDFVFDRAGRPEDVVVGTGNLDLKGLLTFLKEIQFGGALTLEYEGDVNDPVPATRKCVEAVRSVLTEIGA